MLRGQAVLSWNHSWTESVAPSESRRPLILRSVMISAPGRTFSKSIIGVIGASRIPPASSRPKRSFRQMLIAVLRPVALEDFDALPLALHVSKADSPRVFVCCLGRLMHDWVVVAVFRQIRFRNPLEEEPCEDLREMREASM